jgi:hypothetical protein
MRKIKFRALLEKEDGTKEWIYYGPQMFVEPNRWSRSPELNSVDVYTDNAISKCKILARDLQYTGLKDSKGNDIWEGDVIKTDSGNVVVEWLSVGWTAHLLFGDIEVVGNVYENKDLIEVV